jgi:uncharacterized protein (DUF2236 family)
MRVSREDLERSLARVARGVRDPEHGIHGPGSAGWRFNRETVNFLGAGRAVLLQLAHPAVAYGVDEHSVTKVDLQGRFQRTFMNVFSMVFGDLDLALGSARRVYEVHERVVGTIAEDVGTFSAGDEYYANESGALLWVFSTLIDTAMKVQDLTIGPMPLREKQEFYVDSKQFARLFGIPETEIPEDYAAFKHYVSSMLSGPELAVSTPAREMSGFLFLPPLPGLGPLMELYKIITAGLLPPRLRAGFGLPFGTKEKWLYRRALTAAGVAATRMPKVLRYLPAYGSAVERVTGESAYPLAKVFARFALMPSR